MALHRAGQLRFFGGPEAVLAYLSRYTHRVAISNHRLVTADAGTVAFQWKDYRIKRGDRMKVMHLPTFEFILRFVMHVLPDRFHRIRHYGFLSGAGRKEKIAQICALLGDIKSAQADQPSNEAPPPPHCASHAQTAVSKCASSRPSGAGSYL